MSPTVLLTDSLTTLGKSIRQAFANTPCRLVSFGHSVPNWANATETLAVFERFRPDLVVVSEQIPEFPKNDDMSRLIMSSRSLVSACRQWNTVPFFFSNYRVFGEENQSSYDEIDPIAPISAAGQSLAQLESAFATQLTRFIGLRLGWLMDEASDTHFFRLLRYCHQGREIPDYWRHGGVAPIDPTQVANAVVGVVNQVLCGADNWGFFHLQSADPCSLAELANEVKDTLYFANAGHYRVPSETASVLGSCADLAEPQHSVLQAQRLRDEFGVQLRSWRPHLPQRVGQYLALQEAVSLFAGGLNPSE